LTIDLIFEMINLSHPLQLKLLTGW